SAEDRGVVIQVSGGSFEGPALKGTVVAPSGDWQRWRSDGSKLLDIRLLLMTDDDQPINMTARGLHWQPKDGPVYVRILPMFEAGAGKYAWLNHIVSVGVYHPMPGKVVYRIFRIL
ncbi:MAG TPA: DUF3237 domain-containing protein, partial [Parvularculaceae bacterium]|nr:DUF3237 domain-containing protein [Parvularculaceae bacterium]